MNNKSKLKKIKLTEADKKTILKHANACTDLHGKGCGDLITNKNLN